MIAQAKMRMLKCIMVVFECDAHTNAKTVMASNECAMYLNVRRQVIKPLVVGLLE